MYISSCQFLFMYFYILCLTQTLCCTSFTESRFQERFSNMGDRRWNTDSTLADFNRINDALRSQWCSLESAVSEGLSRPFFAPNFQSFFDDEKWYQEDEETKEDEQKDKSEAETDNNTNPPPTEKNEEEANGKKQNPEGKPVVNEYETTIVEEDDETGQKRVTKTAVKEFKDSYTDKNGAKITKVAYSQKSSSVTM